MFVPCWSLQNCLARWGLRNRLKLYESHRDDGDLPQVGQFTQRLTREVAALCIERCALYQVDAARRQLICDWHVPVHVTAHWSAESYVCKQATGNAQLCIAAQPVWNLHLLHRACLVPAMRTVQVAVGSVAVLATLKPSHTWPGRSQRLFSIYGMFSLAAYDSP